MHTITERIRLFLVILLALLIGAFVSSPVRAGSISKSLSGDLNVRAYYNDVSGNKANSFLTEGPGVLSDVYFYYDNTSADTSQIQWNGLLYLQGTDDPRFEIRGDKVRLRNGYLTAHRQNHWKATAGYFSENFTSLTFNSSLLGLNTMVKLTDSVQFKLFGGRANRARPGNKFRRFSEGVQLAWTPTEDNTVSLNYVRTHDDANSLDNNDLTGVNSDTETNLVRSLEYRGDITSTLSVRGEYARSDLDTEPASGLNSSNDQGAGQFSLRWRPVEETELRGYYEKVDPDFTTMSGFARTDRKLKRFNWNQQFGRAWSLLTEYEVWEDGLDSSRENDVTNWSIESNYSPRSTGWWRRQLSLHFRRRINEGGTEGINFKNDSNDEDQRIWGLDLSNQFNQTSLDLGYSRENYESDTETLGIWDLAFNTRFDYGVPVTYMANAVYRENASRPAGSTSDQVDRSVRIENEFLLAEGRAQELRFYHWYTNEDAATSAELVDHTLGTEYRHTLNRKTDSRLDFALEYYGHTDKENPDQDYTERTVEIRYQTPF